jgi:hypothetical protein
MSIRSGSVLTVAPRVRNPKFTLPVRIADGSIYEEVDEVEPAATLLASNPDQFAELDFEVVNGARVSLYRDPEQPQRYQIAINNTYQPDEATDSLEQARFNFKGVQIEVWDARRGNR